MQEFTVHLFDDGSAQIGGTGANLELRFGYSKNAHMYSVKFIRSKEWEDLYIRVHFHPEADIYDVDPVLAQNNIVNIPAMVTSMPGKGKLTIEGTDGYKTITSADIPYRVSENSGIDSETDPEPGESSFQQFVDAVKEDAKSAEQAAKDAESALAETKEAASLALSDIETARTNAISDIEKIESEVKGEIQEDVDSAKSSAEAASKSAEEAKSAADSAKKSLSDLETAKESALSDISKEKDTSVSAVGSAKESALTELSKSASSAIQNVKTAETNAIDAVKAEGSSQKTALSNASNAALTSIDSAKQGAVKAVEDKASEESSAIDEKAAQVIQSVQNAGDAEISAIGQATTSGIEQITKSAGQHLTQIDSAADDAVQDIMDVKEDSLDEFEAVNAHPPIQNPETGKWQVYSAETSSYVDTKYDWEGGYYSPSVDSEGNLTWQASKEGMDDIPSSNIRGPQGLGVPTPTTNDYGKTPTVNAAGTGYELTGPYAPLSAAITETAKGNPVSITDSVEWLLLGLKVYGKSTQVTTTGASLANPADFSTDDKFIYLFQQNPFEIKPGESYSFTFYNDDTVEQDVQVELRENGSNNLIDVAYTNTLSYTNHDETHHFVYFRVYLYESAVPASYRIMLNAGPTALPWEPYTGGKPSPSPEYPQPIVSAGDGGSVELAITGKNLLTGRLYYGAYNTGFAYIQNETVVSLPYTPDYEVVGVCYTVSVKKGVTYTFSVTNPNANANLFLSLYRTFEDAFDYNNAISKVQGASLIFITPSEDGILVCLIAGTWTDRTTKIHECTESELLQLEIGSTATAYETPHSQSITATTPSGLPGIPVDRGGNYTDASGQQWLANYRDWGRGVDVQMCCNVVLDGTTGGGFDNNGIWHMSPSDQKNLFGGVLIFDHSSQEAFSDRFEVQSSAYDTAKNQTFYVSSDGGSCSMSSSLFETPSIDGFKAYFKANPTRFVVPYAEPIETPIPPEELAAYRALHTYDGTTVVTPDDALAEVEVDYIVKPKAYIEKKLTAIETRLNAFEISEALEGE